MTQTVTEIRFTESEYARKKRKTKEIKKQLKILKKLERHIDSIKKLDLFTQEMLLRVIDKARKENIEELEELKQ